MGGCPSLLFIIGILSLASLADSSNITCRSHPRLKIRLHILTWAHAPWSSRPRTAPRRGDARRGRDVQAGTLRAARSLLPERISHSSLPSTDQKAQRQHRPAPIASQNTTKISCEWRVFGELFCKLQMVLSRLLYFWFDLTKGCFFFFLVIAKTTNRTVAGVNHCESWNMYNCEYWKHNCLIISSWQTETAWTENKIGGRRNCDFYWLAFIALTQDSAWVQQG